jgi:hypothetical protein
MDTTVKGLCICKDGVTADLWAHVFAAPSLADVAVEVLPARVLRGPRDAVRLASGQHDFIIMPLGAGRYASLAIAEYINVMRLPTAIILHSATEAPEELLLNVFDYYLPAPFNLSDVERVLHLVRSSTPPRRKTARQARDGITALLPVASCFMASHRDDICIGYRPGSLGDYLEWLADTKSQASERSYPAQCDPKRGLLGRAVRALERAVQGVTHRGDIVANKYESTFVNSVVGGVGIGDHATTAGSATVDVPREQDPPGGR